MSFDFRKSAALAVVSGLLLIAGGFYFFISSPRESGFLITPSPKIHYAGENQVDLSAIKIKAFYFIPQDLEKSADSLWEDIIKNALDSISKFYQFQLHGATNVTYEIYPAPIIGEGKRLVYDSEDTGGGNPHALIEIRKELLRRVFDQNGDLYKEDFSKSSAGSYDVIGIIYQGVGSSATLFTESSTGDSHLISINEGEMPAFIVSYDYFVSPSYEDYGLSIFAHEFGHTLGLTDAYDLETANPLSDDIMGAGRFRPLDTTYLSKEDKKKLGLDY